MGDFEAKLDDIENQIADKIGKQYMKDISETMSHMTGEDGAISHSGIWKSKSRVTADKKLNVPVALKDKKRKFSNQS